MGEAGKEEEGGRQGGKEEEAREERRKREGGGSQTKLEKGEVSAFSSVVLITPSADTPVLLLD